VDYELRRRGYTQGSRQVYGSVLRAMQAGLACAPSEVTAHGVNAYLSKLVDIGASTHWISSNISVLRTVFDGIGDRCVTRHLCTPRRPKTLPHILTRAQVRALLISTGNYRDKLLIGLLYGCGLRTSELLGLRWKQVNAKRRLIVVGDPPRSVSWPMSLGPLLKAGVRSCPGQAFVIAGIHPHKPLSKRMPHLIVRNAGVRAGIQVPVTCLQLRQAHAVHALESGANLRELQARLGFKHISSLVPYMAMARGKSLRVRRS
jgi:integrase/recombinase XerD